MEGCNTSDGVFKARVVVQQCLSAKLLIKPATENSPAENSEINRGMIFFLCFMKGADEHTVNKIVKDLLNLRLCEGADGKQVSILDLPGDLLIIPQFCLGGKMKGKAVQYHGICTKSEGELLFKDLVQKCTEKFSQSEKCREAGANVKYGTYGNRQVLSTVTNGPYTHVFDF